MKTPSTRRLTLVLGTLSAIGPFSIDMYLPSFPTLARSLGTSVSSVQLTLATYLAGLAAGQLLYGPLADRLGRRTPLLAGLALYVAASLACAAAPDLPFLAAARFVQALGGCAGMVIARAVVRDFFDERESARLYSSLMLVMGAAPILAPLVGGQLLAHAGWRAIFVTLAGIGAAMFTLVATSLPESLPVDARRRQGFREIARSLGELLRQLPFVRLSLAGGAMQAAMFAYIAGSPFVFIELHGVPAERFGLIFGTNAFGLIAASQINRWLVPRLGVLRVLRTAIAGAALAYVGLLIAAGSGAGLPVILPLIFVGIASVGFALPNSTALAMAPQGKRAGLASALLGTLQTTCGALASTLVSALADGSAQPMAAVMLGCGLLALVAAAPFGWKGISSERGELRPSS
ncbi:multidrug effflux MFS transporter [Vulgatibacter incomptus]|uniref:Multidrug resistance transporter, Bcr/CflA family n=1 Tax=Vulgatibacter incomptus TaxID=1391653 RepID=A0A0K1PHF4_9BACT|nr:multidrug effflux MFS transporter [Vulgatibacter incomptus]AKU92549.1 Multidrug resistance transporter, Bcr/CflA family [Vulgatibacter incomptus]